MKKLHKEIVKQLPNKIYDDAVHPSMSIVGQSVSNIFKFVALPFTFLGLTADQLEEKYRMFIEDAVNKTPYKKMKNPNPAIVGPLLDYVKYVFDEDDLSDLFNNLLSSAINKDKENLVHPSFVHIIKQLSGMDAQILKGLYEYGNSHILYSNITVYNKDESDDGIIVGCSHDLWGVTLLNVEQHFSLNSTKTSIDYLISMGLLELQLQKRYTKDDYLSVVKGHIDYRNQFKDIPNFKYKSSESIYLDAFLNRSLIEGKEYPHKDEYNLIPIEDSRYDFCDIEINTITEEAMKDISKSSFPRTPAGNQYLLPQRGYLSFTEIGKRFMKCCVNDK